MTYIKKMMIYGFKSFGMKTEIPFQKSMNVIIGPNGSGKSNITDALCFALGRMSFKSMRVAKAANLLFSGNAKYKGSSEATVELIFDNKNREFPLDKDDVSIKRIVRKDGQSVYKIDNQTKTRNELLELLAQGGIDPQGFNIVLQGDIASMIKMSSEERRKVIEDIAGISIYETRKEKSQKELEKTEENLRQAKSVLNERNKYMKNLEKERQDALNFQKLNLTINRGEKTIINVSISEKEKEIWGYEKTIEGINKEITVLQKKVEDRNNRIEELNLKITMINKKIQEATKEEQTNLNNEVSDLKSFIAGCTVRKENYERGIKHTEEIIKILDEKKERLEQEINNIQTNSPDIKKKQNEQKRLQEELDKLEQKRRRFYLLRSQVETSDNQIREKDKYLIESEKEIKILEGQIESITRDLKYSNTEKDAESLRIETKNKIFELTNLLKQNSIDTVAKEREDAVIENNIKQEEKLRDSILNLDKCPMCKQNVGEDYKSTIRNDSQSKIDEYVTIRNKNSEIYENLKDEKIKLNDSLSMMNTKISDIQRDIYNLNNISDKNERIKKIVNQRHETKEQVESLNKKFNELNKEYHSLDNIEEQYEEVRSKLQEINFADIDIDSEVSVKQREIARLDTERRNNVIEMEKSSVELKKCLVFLEDKTKELNKKTEELQKVQDECQELYEEKQSINDSRITYETDNVGYNRSISDYNNRIGSLKVKKAETSGQLESLKSAILKYAEFDIFNLPIAEVKEKVAMAKLKISNLGNVNMKALETFDKVMEQVKLISAKVDTLEAEKIKILEIIDEIDKKKKKSFMMTFDAVNEIFVRNCSSLLSNKGSVSLDLENKKDPFVDGVNIIIKTSKSKYFDITSLSGGEKTMVSLALIFAIQEFKPYCFYIFDEIDSALDKNNSEVLSALINKYMKSGQYIVITHNDALISDASTLYGVSMQENISKVISLKLDSQKN